MSTTANGWPVLDGDTTGPLPRLRKFIIPGTGRYFLLRDGCLGFLLAYVALRFHDTIERLDITGDVWDEWAYAVRPVRGQTTGYSNHAGGVAVDLNATRHPISVPISHTFTPRQIRQIRWLMKYRLLGCVQWGGEWNRPDGMHFENVGGTLTKANRLALVLVKTRRGRQIIDANPGLLAVIKS